MFGLCMYEEYLIGILKGNRMYDARLYPTNKRGKIGLIKSRTNLLYGYIELVSISEITFEDYVYWHIGDNYSLEDANEFIRLNNLQDNKIAYAYNFANPILFEVPRKIKVINKKGSWVEFDEDICQGKYNQLSLF